MEVLKAQEVDISPPINRDRTPVIAEMGLEFMPLKTCFWKQINWEKCVFVLFCMKHITSI